MIRVDIAQAQHAYTDWARERNNLRVSAWERQRITMLELVRQMEALNVVMRQTRPRR